MVRNSIGSGRGDRRASHGPSNSVLAGSAKYPQNYFPNDGAVDDLFSNSIVEFIKSVQRLCSTRSVVFHAPVLSRYVTKLARLLDHASINCIGWSPADARVTTASQSIFDKRPGSWTAP